MKMTEHDPNDIEMSGPDVQNSRRDEGHNPEVNQPGERPYGNAGNLYEIPRIRPEDPPMRRWWTDDEPQQEGGDSR